MIEGIDIGAQQVARYPRLSFDLEHVFGGKTLRGLKPFPHTRLPHPTNARDRRLPAGKSRRFLQCFERGQFRIHIETNSFGYCIVNSDTFIA